MKDFLVLPMCYKEGCYAYGSSISTVNSAYAYLETFYPVVLALVD